MCKPTSIHGKTTIKQQAMGVVGPILNMLIAVGLKLSKYRAIEGWNVVRAHSTNEEISGSTDRMFRAN